MVSPVNLKTKVANGRTWLMVEPENRIKRTTRNHIEDTALNLVEVNRAAADIHSGKRASLPRVGRIDGPRVIGGWLQSIRQDLHLGDEEVRWFLDEGDHQIFPIEFARRSDGSACATSPRDRFLRWVQPSSRYERGLSVDDPPSMLVLWCEDREFADWRTDFKNRLRPGATGRWCAPDIETTWSAFRERLASKQHQLAHVACHGLPGKLTIGGEEVDAQAVKAAFSESDIRAAVCSVCFSSDAPTGSKSIAKTIAEAGVGAVVTWTGKASIHEALRFAAGSSDGTSRVAGFWQALLSGASLDEAMLEGRTRNVELALLDQWATVNLTVSTDHTHLRPGLAEEWWTQNGGSHVENARQVERRSTRLRIDDGGAIELPLRQGGSGPPGLALVADADVDVDVDVGTLYGVGADGRFAPVDDDRILAAWGETDTPRVIGSPRGEVFATTVGNRIHLVRTSDHTGGAQVGPEIAEGAELLAVAQRNDGGFAAITATDDGTSLVRWTSGKHEPTRPLASFRATSACICGPCYYLVGPAGLVAFDWDGIEQEVTLPIDLPAVRGVAAAQRYDLESPMWLLTLEGPEGALVRAQVRNLSNPAQTRMYDGLLTAWLVPDRRPHRAPWLVQVSPDRQLTRHSVAEL